MDVLLPKIPYQLRYRITAPRRMHPDGKAVRRGITSLKRNVNVIEARDPNSNEMRMTK